MTAIPDTLAPLTVPIDSVTPYGDNPREGDVGAICVSLERNGQYRPIVVNQRDGQILAGNHTWKAAKSLGWQQIAATYVDVDDETARRIVLVDNRSNDLAAYDDAVLAALLEGIVEEHGVDGLVGTGFDGDDLDELLADLVEDLPDGATDPDDVPEPPAEPVSKLGDVWLLGRHRVVCGDSTDVGVLDRVMDGGKAGMVWTDPPYGIGVVGGSRALSPEKRRAQGGKEISNDTLDLGQLTDFLREAFGSSVTVCASGAGWYVAAPHGPIGLAFATVLHELEVWRHSLVWVKDSIVMGRSDYHYRHEPIYYGWVPGAAHTWESDRKQDTVLEFPRPRKSKEHPTMKPVALIEYCIGNSSKRGAVVLDPFGGSGSTLLAAHRTGRTARLVELDPAYVDVICRRYQEHTGEKPVLEATGEPHDFTADG